MVLPWWRLACASGTSSRPPAGHDTWTLAGDVHTLVPGRLGVTGSRTVVGHDVGSMEALAHGQCFRRLLTGGTTREIGTVSVTCSVMT
jgi:hypothetical protein